MQHFFSLYSKQLHFLLKYPGALLSCWSVLKAAISNEAIPLSRYICTLQMILNPAKSRGDHT